MPRQREILRLDAEATSDEGRILTYLKADSAVPYRMAVFRALRVFYLPWALETEQSPDELQRLARTVLEEMQLRSLQLHSRFLASAEKPIRGALDSHNLGLFSIRNASSEFLDSFLRADALE